MEQEKNTQILMKDSEQKTVHCFFYKNNLKRTMRFTGKQEQNKNNQRKAEINTKYKFRKQKCTLINK